MAQDPAAELAEQIKGKSDEDIQTAIDARGVDTTLEEIFKGMETAFDAEKAASTQAVVQYDIDSAGETKTWTVNIDNGTIATSAGAADNPRLTLQSSLPNFLRLISGEAQGPALFMSGKLKIKGDMMFAMQMQNFFKRA